jgi:hypothetical protein
MAYISAPPPPSWQPAGLQLVAARVTTRWSAGVEWAALGAHVLCLSNPGGATWGGGIKRIYFWGVDLTVCTIIIN